ELPGAAARPLGRDRDRQPFPQRLRGGLQRLDRLGAVGAVDEDRPGERERGPEDGIAAHFLLADGDEVAMQELAQDQDVDRALVVEDEDRRPVRPEMLLSRHRDADPSERAAKLAPGGGGEVDHLPPAPFEDPSRHAEQQRWPEARDRERRAYDVHHAGETPGVKGARRPAAPRGDGGELAVGVGGTWAADVFEERQVLVAGGGGGGPGQSHA